MLRILGLFFIALVTFGGGYFFGSNQLGEISKSLIAFKEEMSKKTTALEREVNKLRLRMTLVDIRNHLNHSIDENDQRNFGNAQMEIKEAKSKLKKAITLADEALQKDLKRINHQLSQIDPKAEPTDARGIERIEKIKGEVSQLISNE